MKTKNMLKNALLFTALTGAMISCSDDDSNGGMNPDPQDATAKLYTTNNADGNVKVFDVSNMNSVSMQTLVTASGAADGAYYNADTDAAIQVSRSNNSLEGFLDVSLIEDDGVSINVDLSGNSDMQNPRELAVSGNFYVVADSQDVDGDPATLDGSLYIYQMQSNGTFMLRNTVTTNFKVWGITFINNDLYAVVDATNELAVFSNFLASNTSNTAVMATKTVAVEGIVRTHGLTYDMMSDTMVMTDIGDAGNTSTDGGLHIISNFMSTFNGTMDGGMIGASAQTMIAGSSTMLGNPVDVAFDGETIYVAEAGNGMILAFDGSASGNVSPIMSAAVASASSVYLYKE